MKLNMFEGLMARWSQPIRRVPDVQCSAKIVDPGYVAWVHAGAGVPAETQNREA